MRILVAASDKAELASFGDGYIKVVTGVGPVLAAAAVAAAAAVHHPDVIVSTGTAGSMGSLAVGDIVSFGSVISLDSDLTAYGLKRGETLLANHRRVSSFSLDPHSSLILSSSSSFATVRGDHADSADMEAYGVAAAAFLSGFPCLAVKAITDIVGEKPEMREYLALRKRLVGSLAQKVDEIISSI